MAQVKFALCFMQEWISILSAKKSYFVALTEYHQGSVAKEKGAFGEQDYRLKVYATEFDIFEQAQEQ